MAESFVGKVFNCFTKASSNDRSPENLAEASLNKEYTIKEIKTVQEDLKDFLFTLGCYEGETITVISILSDNYVIVVKDARYSIDKELAQAIII